jgi:BA14K-like protein
MRSTFSLSMAALVLASASVLAIDPAAAQRSPNDGGQVTVKSEGQAGASVPQSGPSPQSASSAQRNTNMNMNMNAGMNRSARFSTDRSIGNRSYADRSYGRSYRNDRRWIGPAAGLAAGAVIGGALAGGYPAYGDGYAYYDEGYPSVGYYDDATPVYGSDDAEGYCAARFRSYDPASGTYLGYDGLRHPCP